MNGTDWIQTFTGKKFFPLNPNPADICIEDIAHSLAMQCRYVGHCKQFYSVAQHCWLMSRHWFKKVELQRYALLHDAAEAYLSDLPRPLKHLPQFQFYRDAEKVLQRLIYIRFGLNPIEPEAIKRADYEVLCEEAASDKIMSPLHPDWQEKCKPLMMLHPQSPEKAEILFLEQYYKIFDAEK